MIWRFALPILLCCVPSIAFAEASTFCLYSLLVEAHVMVSHCGDHLDGASEGRYQEMLNAVRKNIVENTHQPGKTTADVEKQAAQYEKKLQDQYRNKDRAICGSKDFANTEVMLKNFTTLKTSSKILDSLKGLKRDPYEGDCL